MAVTKYDLIVHYDDEREPVTVVADQRDISAFERAEKVGVVKAMDEMPMTFFRALAWFAMRRTGLAVGVRREDWESEVIEVEIADDEPVDPTNQEASAER